MYLQTISEIIYIMYINIYRERGRLYIPFKGKSKIVAVQFGQWDGGSGEMG